MYNFVGFTCICITAQWGKTTIHSNQSQGNNVVTHSTRVNNFTLHICILLLIFLSCWYVCQQWNTEWIPHTFLSLINCFSLKNNVFRCWWQCTNADWSIMHHHDHGHSQAIISIITYFVPSLQSTSSIWKFTVALKKAKSWKHSVRYSGKVVMWKTALYTNKTGNIILIPNSDTNTTSVFIFIYLSMSHT